MAKYGWQNGTCSERHQCNLESNGRGKKRCLFQGLLYSLPTLWCNKHSMQQLVFNKQTKHIGLSNFNCQHIRQILSIARVRPTSLQIECHPHLSQSKLIRFAREAGIRVSAFSCLGGASYLSIGMATDNDLLFDNPDIRKICHKHNKTAAQVLLRWAMQRNTLPINKSSSKKRMIENRGVFDFYLTKEEMESIDSLNLNRRYNDPGHFCEEGMGTFCPIYE